jgi:hypothetical protein
MDESNKQTSLEQAFFDGPILPYKIFNRSKSVLSVELARENCELAEKIDKLKYFLENNPEEYASQKQIELMKKQLSAMECYKFYLCCRIADLVISDIEPKEKEESK